MARAGEFNQPMGEPIKPKFQDEVGVLIATGPSLTLQQLDVVRDAQLKGACRVFTVNNAYQLFQSTDVQVACNYDWWEWYWNKDQALRDMPADKYTWYFDIAGKYKITYVKGIVHDGLSTDPKIVHINHGSGPLALNIALHYGIKKLLLIAHDLKFAPDYNGRKKLIGSSKRHFFGEYPAPLTHWPSVKIGLSEPGVIDGLIEAYDKMHPEKVGMTVINCTPNSALPSFPMSTLEEHL